MPTPRNRLRRSPKLKEDEFYCVACRKRCKSSKEDICVIQFINGNHALYGYCKPCDCDTYKIIKNKDVSRLKKKYGEC